jgi:diguanylate cyclase
MAPELQVTPPAAALLAKGALRRLAQARLEPTPENYARAWAEEAGVLSSDAATVPDARTLGQAWAQLIERLARGLERGGRNWTAARRKDGLQRVLQGSRGDVERLRHRLDALIRAWDDDRPTEAAEPVADAAPAAGPTAVPDIASAAPDPMAADPAAAASPLLSALQQGLAADDPRASELAGQLGRVARRLQSEGLSAALIAELESLGREVERWFGHRHELVGELLALCRQLSAGITELAEDESWVRGQGEQLQSRLAQGLNRRALHAAGELLADARKQQQRVRGERAAARDVLKELLTRMLGEVGELGRHAGNVERVVERHGQAITQARSLEGLAEVVQAMLADSRAAAGAVRASSQRLHEHHEHAQALEQRVRDLEAELRRISDQASTDALTQVSNRRGLERAFEAEAARAALAVAAGEPGLAVGLIDIDNFKKLNDRLGHAAGDVALRSLAAAVQERLRPVDHLARFGGEEFVVLLPATPLDDAQQALTRLQRSLSSSLFLHEGEEVFVTFSAGVTTWRDGEALEAALARADEALYEAKRTGKNRTCKS